MKTQRVFSSFDCAFALLLLFLDRYVIQDFKGWNGGGDLNLWPHGYNTIILPLELLL